MQSDDHFLTVCRYVERTALHSSLVERANDWTWGSLRLGVPRTRGPARH